MARDAVIGLDVGTSAVKIVVGETGPSNELLILNATQKPLIGMRKGYVVDIDQVSEDIEAAVKEAERISNKTIRHAVIGIGGIKLETLRAKGMVIVSRADNEIAESDVKRAIEQAESNLNHLNRVANKTIIHRLPFAFKIDGEIIPGRPIGVKGEKLEADTLFVASLSQHLDDLIKSVENSRVAIDDIVAGPLAAACAVLTKRQKEVGVSLVDIGAETTSIAVFEEDRLLSLEVFPFGSSHITNDIALGLQVSLEEAEQLKFHYVSDNQKRKLGDIIDARLGDIFELIQNHLKKIGRNELLPAGAVIIGGGANLPNREDFAKNSLKLPAKIGVPAINIKSHDKQIYNPKWATALGLCILASDENLNPDLSAGIKKPGRNNPFLNSFLKWFKSFLP